MFSHNRTMISVIMNTLRVLKKINPGDCYYENYQSHLDRDGDNFFDTYTLMWYIGANISPQRILEIGTRTGLSLCQLLSAYRDHSKISRIVCIDPFADQFLSQNLVRKNMRYLNLPADKVEFIEEASRDALPKLIDNPDESFDYILVDGDHSKNEAANDLELAHRLLETGGVIVFDDISPYGCGLIDVWDEFKKKHDDEYMFDQVMTGKGVGWATRKK